MHRSVVHRTALFVACTFIIALTALHQPVFGASPWTVVSSSSSEQTERSSPNSTATALKLASGTPYETRYVVNDSGKPGPTVLVVGGVHGNETAGYMAARRIESVVPARGKLIVIPEANRLGIQANARTGGHPGDLNRHFPKTASAKPQSPLAKSIWSLVQTLKPDYILDLHEGYDYHRLNSNSVGQTIIYYPKGKAATMARNMIDAVNADIRTVGHRYTLLKYPVKGSLTRAAAMFTSAETMILETSRKQPLDVRIHQHVTMVQTALRHLNMAS